MRLFIMVVCVLFLAGCVRSGKAPLEVRFDGPVEEAEHMVIFLPGLGSNVHQFFEKEFPQTAAKGERYADSSFLAAGTHLGYYRDRTLPNRFRQDVLEVFPDRRRTLVGISLGGMGATGLARFFPGEVEEIVLIAPFLGKGKLVERYRSGDLEPRPDDSDRDRFLLQNWAWLISNPEGVKISLLFGEQDRLSEAHRLLVEQAPHICVVRQPGKHRWKTWIPLWQTFQQNPCP